MLKKSNKGQKHIMIKTVFNPNSQLLFIYLLMFVVMPRFVLADVGPKPSVVFDIYYNGDKISDDIFYAEMLSCVEETDSIQDNGEDQLNISLYDSIFDCYWRPAKLAGGGRCEFSRCEFGYMPPDEFKLAVYIPSLDQTFISGMTIRQTLNSSYKVLLESDGSAKIHETTSIIYRYSKIASFFKALIITLLIEVFIAFIYLSYRKLSKKIIISVIIGSIITLPIVWYITPMFRDFILVLILCEIFATVFEALFIFLLNKNKISLKSSFVLSILINVFSFFVGGFIHFVTWSILGI